MWWKKMMIHQQYFHWNVFCIWYFERLKGKWCNIEQLEKVIMHQYTFSGLTKDGQKLCSLSKNKMTLPLEKVQWMYYNIITSLHNSNLFVGIRWIQNCLSKCKGLPRALATVFRTDLTCCAAWGTKTKSFAVILSLAFADKKTENKGRVHYVVAAGSFKRLPT